MQVCTSLQTDNHASTPPLNFLQAGCPSCCPTNSVEALKALTCYYYQYCYYRAAVDGVDLLDGAGVDVEVAGELRQQDIEVGGGPLVEQFARDAARSRPGADHKYQLVARRHEQLADRFALL